jgi:hypothetical protein
MSTVLSAITGTAIYSPENPNLAAVEDYPALRIQRIDSGGEFLLNGTRFTHADRMQVNMVALTITDLLSLVHQVETLLDMNTKDFILSFPLGVMGEGQDTTPDLFTAHGDWLVMY